LGSGRAEKIGVDGRKQQGAFNGERPGPTSASGDVPDGLIGVVGQLEILKPSLRGWSADFLFLESSLHVRKDNEVSLPINNRLPLALISYRRIFAAPFRNRAIA
jgi:hypothetical protein